MIRSTLFAALVALAAVPSYAGPSGQHSAAAVDHSAQAASHGSAAAVSGASTVASVPIVAVGSAIAITGSALEEVGEGAIGLGLDLSHIATGEEPLLHSNAAPKLD